MTCKSFSWGLLLMPFLDEIRQNVENGRPYQPAQCIMFFATPVNNPQCKSPLTIIDQWALCCGCLVALKAGHPKRIYSILHLVTFYEWVSLFLFAPPFTRCKWILSCPWYLVKGCTYFWYTLRQKLPPIADAKSSPAKTASKVCDE